MILVSLDGYLGNIAYAGKRYNLICLRGRSVICKDGFRSVRCRLVARWVDGREGAGVWR